MLFKAPRQQTRNHRNLLTNLKFPFLPFQTVSTFNYYCCQTVLHQVQYCSFKLYHDPWDRDLSQSLGYSGIFSNGSLELELLILTSGCVCHVTTHVSHCHAHSLSTCTKDIDSASAERR